MRLISWNVNGIRAIHKKGFLSWLQSERPDILCLQETKAQPDQIPKELSEVDGYHCYFNSADRKGYSGVALYTKKEPVDVVFGFGDENFQGEGRTIQADFGDFILYTIYFPNGGASEERLKYKLEFYDSFLKRIIEQKQQGKKIIVCGDVNTAHMEIDLARPQDNLGVSGFLPIERHWMDRLTEAGFIDTFRMFNKEAGNYSWWSYRTRARDRNIGWRIDYFFASQNLKDQVVSSRILSDVEGSDHCPIELTIR